MMLMALRRERGKEKEERRDRHTPLIGGVTALNEWGIGGGKDFY